MALDIGIPSGEFDLREWVSITSEEHKQLMNLARTLACPLLLRAHDYYGDAVQFEVSKLPALLNEIAAVQAAAPADLAVMLAALTEIARKAELEGEPLLVLPD